MPDVDANFAQLSDSPIACSALWYLRCGRVQVPVQVQVHTARRQRHKAHQPGGLADLLWEWSWDIWMPLQVGRRQQQRLGSIHTQDEKDMNKLPSGLTDSHAPALLVLPHGVSNLGWLLGRQLADLAFLCPFPGADRSRLLRLVKHCHLFFIRLDE